MDNISYVYQDKRTGLWKVIYDYDYDYKYDLNNEVPDKFNWINFFGIIIIIIGFPLLSIIILLSLWN